MYPDGVTPCEIPSGESAFYPLDPTCYNPCIEDDGVPGAQFLEVTAADDVVMDKGYLRPNGEFIHFPSLLTIFPNSNCNQTEPAGGALGNVHYVSPQGVVWGAAQFGCRLTRLTPLPPP